MTGLTPGSASGLTDGFTPGSLISPNMWPDTTRSLGGNGAFKPPGELAAAAAAAAAASSSAAVASGGGGQQQAGGVRQQQQQQQQHLGGAGGSAPLVSPASMAAATAGSAPYKGIQFDKDRGKWQVGVDFYISPNVIL